VYRFESFNTVITFKQQLVAGTKVIKVRRKAKFFPLLFMLQVELSLYLLGAKGVKGAKGAKRTIVFPVKSLWSGLGGSSLLHKYAFQNA
jgi:hypothetical protein